MRTVPYSISDDDRDVIITAATQDGSHNGYIYGQADSEGLIENCEISYVGVAP